MHKVIRYREGGIVKSKEFPIKGYRNSTGLHIREYPYKEIAEFIREVDFLGSFVRE